MGLPFGSIPSSQQLCALAVKCPVLAQEVTEEAKAVSQSWSLCLPTGKKKCLWCTQKFGSVLSVPELCWGVVLNLLRAVVSQKAVRGGDFLMCPPPRAAPSTAVQCSGHNCCSSLGEDGSVLLWGRVFFTCRPAEKGMCAPVSSSWHHVLTPEALLRHY